MKKKQLKILETIGIIVEMIIYQSGVFGFIYFIYITLKYEDYFFTIFFLLMLILIIKYNFLYFRNKIKNGFYDNKYSIKEINNSKGRY